MEYIRQNLELLPVGGAGRMRGMLRAEIRDSSLKIRISLENLPPAPYGTYSAEMICVKNQYYRRYPLGFIRTDARGRGELLYRRSAEEKEGPGPENFQTFYVRRGRGTSEELLMARVEGASNERDLTEWSEGITGNQEEQTEAVIVQSEEKQITEEDTPLETYRGEEEVKDYLLKAMPALHPFYQSERKWVRVDPGDLAPLPLNLTQLENSPFLMKGYTRYKHLILSQGKNDYQLGIPYRYAPEMAPEAAKAECYEFRASHGQAAKKGDFGYWIRIISMK